MMNLEDDYKLISKDLVCKIFDKNEVFGRSDLHAIAMTLATKSRIKDCLESSSSEIDNRKDFINSCENSQCLQQLTVEHVL